MPNESKRSFPGKLLAIPGRQLLFGTLSLAVVAVILLIGLKPVSLENPTAVPSPGANQVGTVQGTQVASGCQVIQELSYTPCGHSITRRMDIPTELVGKQLGDVEAAYDLYRVTSFLPNEITMEQELNMFCAKHVVLLPDESGFLCVFQNKYGDALALLDSLELPISDLPESIQEEIRKGKGFDDLAALEQWLESVES